jgi:hypothetical protein
MYRPGILPYKTSHFWNSSGTSLGCGAKLRRRERNKVKEVSNLSVYNILILLTWTQKVAAVFIT